MPSLGPSRRPAGLWPLAARTDFHVAQFEDVTMRNYDLSPLFRSSVGFDRLARLVDTATRTDEASLSYPPYNIEKLGDDAYRVTMAVAGFGIDEIDITLNENTLTVTGAAKPEEKSGQFLHRGIARRAFERRFQLADHIKVRGATLSNGLLDIDLVREVPETLKPRKIDIRPAVRPAAVIDQAAA
jgi:molecular chaperone IbpA